MTDREPIDVLLVEDHPMFRFGLRTRLEAEPDIVVVGEAGTAGEARALVEDTAPDVAVVDLNLPGEGGVALIRDLVAAAPRVACLVLTMLSDESVTAAVQAGARGYLLKDAEPARIVAAVRTVAAGESVFSPPRPAACSARWTRRPRSQRVPRAHRPGARDPRAPRGRAGQRRDRPPARPATQDGAQLRLERPRQAARRRPGRGDPARPPRRDRFRTSLMPAGEPGPRSGATMAR